MHEFSLYGTIASTSRSHVEQQLAGVCRMQPQQVEEIHLIFKAKPPSGLGNLPSSGGSQGVMQQDLQKVKNMLNTSLYYIQLVGVISTDKSTARNESVSKEIDMQDADIPSSNTSPVQWFLDFKDTPDPGKQVVSSRLISRTPLEGGDIVQFLEQFGYEYVSRYFVQGHKFYDQNMTLFLHQVLHLPQSLTSAEAMDIPTLPSSTDLRPVDPGQQHILQASIDVVDGNHPELRDRATTQLLGMKQTLRQAVDLTPGDRLALDTKIPTVRRI